MTYFEKLTFLAEVTFKIIRLWNVESLEQLKTGSINQLVNEYCRFISHFWKVPLIFRDS